ncbi:DUF3995 domain-containing protein [Streptomyces sp. ISL-100]|nr:DUF3995 domain-containing protein [Streptomyces sp. ISL-100]
MVRTVVPTVLTIVLIAIGLLHFIWAFSPWPMKDAMTFTKTIGGSDDGEMPPGTSTVLVGLPLIGGAVLTIAYSTRRLGRHCRGSCEQALVTILYEGSSVSRRVLFVRLWLGFRHVMRVYHPAAPLSREQTATPTIRTQNRPWAASGRSCRTPPHSGAYPNGGLRPAP